MVHQAGRNVWLTSRSVLNCSRRRFPFLSRITIAGGPFAARPLALEQGAPHRIVLEDHFAGLVDVVDRVIQLAEKLVALLGGGFVVFLFHLLRQVRVLSKLLAGFQP